MPEIAQVKRRLAAIEKPIAEIEQQDLRVRIVGTVIDQSANSIVVDDGSGKLEIEFDEIPNVKIGDRARIVTRVYPLIDGFDCRGEAVQKLENFNMDLYKKAKEIIKSI